MAALPSPPINNKHSRRAGRLRPALLIPAAAWLLAAWLRADARPAFRLEEVLSVGGPQSDLLSMWVGAAVDSEGFIYLTDALEGTLKKFDSNGRPVKKAAWPRPPNDAFRVRRYPLDLWDRAIFVVVPSPFQSSIRMFDANLEPKGSIVLDEAADDLQALPGGLLAYSSVSLSKGGAGRVKIIDLAGRPRRTIACGQRDDPPALSALDFRFGADGSLYVVFNYLDRIAKFDGRGRLLWARGLLGVTRVKTKKILFADLPETPTFKDIALDGRGRLFVLGGGYSAHRSRDVYILDSEGRLLGSLILPQPSHCLVIDGRGFLYAREDEGMTIKKFRVIVQGENDARL